MTKRKIALCITELDVGGAERALVELATRLDRERFEPIVYCLGPRPTSDAASCVPPLEKAGIEVHCLGGRGSWRVVSITQRLRSLFKADRPDLVQCFLFHANLVGRLAAIDGIAGPVVCGIRVAEPRRWHLWADRLTSGWVHRYVCVSESVARFSADRGRLLAEKLVVIPNAVDLDRHRSASPIDPTTLGVALGHRMVTYVGRLDSQKGVQWLIESAPSWLDQVPDADLVLVGQGPHRPKLEQLRKELGLVDRVHFAGWRNDVPEILASTDLLVLPSKWEGMPNVVLEAMAHQLPVVASDVEGVRELLGPAADEQTVRHGDSARLTKKISNILSDRQVASQLGRQNQDRVEREFTFDRVVTAYQNLWESLVGSS